MQKIREHKRSREQKSEVNQRHMPATTPSTTDTLQKSASVPDLNNLTPDAIRRLQATHGNHFAQRLVQQAQPTGAAAPQFITTYLDSAQQANRRAVGGSTMLVQRVKTGLQKEVKNFVKGVERVGGTIDGEAARQRLDNEINAYLGKHTVPRADIVAVAMPSREIHGNFERKIWKIRLNQDLVVNKTLTNQEYRELAATIFHEARHGEQFFSMARYIASQVESIKGIDDEAQLAYHVRLAMQGDIPANIALLAAQNRKMSKHKQLFAREMYESMYQPIDEVVNKISGPLGAGAKTEKKEFMGTYAKLHQAKTEFDEVEGFVTDYNLQRPVSEMERRRRKQPNALIAAWKTRAPNYLNLYYEHVMELAYATTTVYRVAMKEYNNLVIEQDAFGIEEMVRKKLGIQHGGGQLVPITMPNAPDKVANRNPDFEPTNLDGWIENADFELQDTDKVNQTLITKNRIPLVVDDMINGRWKVTSHIYNTMYGVLDTKPTVVNLPPQAQDYTGLNEGDDFMVMGTQCMTDMNLNIGDTLNGQWRVTGVLPNMGMKTYKVEKM